MKGTIVACYLEARCGPPAEPMHSDQPLAGSGRSEVAGHLRDKGRTAPACGRRVPCSASWGTHRDPDRCWPTAATGSRRGSAVAAWPTSTGRVTPVGGRPDPHSRPAAGEGHDPHDAAELGRSPSTVSREIRRNRHPESGAYRPHAAQAHADARRPRSRSGKIGRLGTGVHDPADHRARTAVVQPAGAEVPMTRERRPTRVGTSVHVVGPSGAAPRS